MSASPIYLLLFGAMFGLVVALISTQSIFKSAQIGIVVNIVVGMIGGASGAFIMDELTSSVTPFNIYTLLGAVAGAILLLFIVTWFWHQTGKNLPKGDQEVQASVPPKPSVKKVPSDNIFLSYRRSDSQAIADRIYDRLVPAFGKRTVFKDVDSIPPGVDFKKYLDEQVSECKVLLAIIGNTWLTAHDEKGKRRLEDPRDFVRIEIESALERDITVIPILVNGASMPSEEELPEGLKKLAFRNANAIRHDPDFHNDMNRLIAHLKSNVKPKRVPFRN